MKKTTCNTFNSSLVQYVVYSKNFYNFFLTPLVTTRTHMWHWNLPCNSDVYNFTIQNYRLLARVAQGKAWGVLGILLCSCWDSEKLVLAIRLLRTKRQINSKLVQEASSSLFCKGFKTTGVPGVWDSNAGPSTWQSPRYTTRPGMRPKWIWVSQVGSWRFFVWKIQLQNLSLGRWDYIFHVIDKNCCPFAQWAKRLCGRMLNAKFWCWFTSHKVCEKFFYYYVLEIFCSFPYNTI